MKKFSNLLSLFLSLTLSLSLSSLQLPCQILHRLLDTPNLAPSFHIVQHKHPLRLFFFSNCSFFFSWLFPQPPYVFLFFIFSIVFHELSLPFAPTQHLLWQQLPGIQWYVSCLLYKNEAWNQQLFVRNNNYKKLTLIIFFEYQFTHVRVNIRFDLTASLESGSFARICHRLFQRDFWCRVCVARSTHRERTIWEGRTLKECYRPRAMCMPRL